MACPGSIAANQGITDSGSPAAFEGTVAHDIAERALSSGVPVSTSVGREFVDEDTLTMVTVTEDMAAFVQQYVDFVEAEYAKLPDPKILGIETKLRLDAVTGELGARGTADAVLVSTDALHIVDLKFGRGEQVDAEDNPQLLIYALAALDDYGIVFDGIRTVKLTIHQPRLNHVSTSEYPIAYVEAFRARVQSAVDAVLQPLPVRHAGVKQCRWCRAKASCPEFQASVAEEVGFDPADPSEFDDVSAVKDKPDDVLGKSMQAVPLVEMWCKAIRAETERRLLAGTAVAGFKLVQGKRGNRVWVDAEDAARMLKSFRLKTEEMFDLKLISPTSAEKLLKTEHIGPRQWTRLVPLITQSDGQPSVAPEADQRPALSLTAAAEDFSDLTKE
jgi:hypothetical protein